MLPMRQKNKFIFIYFLNFLIKLPHDYQPFNITYEEITDKLELGHGRFGIVYK
jgi:hypothetical protein